MKTYRIFVISAFILFLLNACAPAYIPTVINTPQFSNKGEFQGSVHTATSGFNSQFGYAFTDHFGLILNGSYMNSTSDSSTNFHKHQLIELAPGYFTKMGKHGHFEVFAGGGYGKIQSEYTSPLWSNTAETYNTKFFLQPTLGFTSTVFDFGFSSRFVMVNFKQKNISMTQYFLEPAFTVKLGYKYVKAVLQVGLSFPTNKQNLAYDYEPVFFSLGLQATLGRDYD